MKYLYISLLILLGIPVNAQFTEVQTIVPTHNYNLLNFAFRAYEDLNGDGWKDLILADSWMPGSAEGDFGEIIYFDSSYKFYEFFPLDYDDDGDVDLLPRLLVEPDDLSVAGLL